MIAYNVCTGLTLPNPQLLPHQTVYVGCCVGGTSTRCTSFNNSIQSGLQETGGGGGARKAESMCRCANVPLFLWLCTVGMAPDSTFLGAISGKSRVLSATSATSIPYCIAVMTMVDMMTTLESIPPGPFCFNS